MELIEEQRMRETARAFAVDLYRDDNFMEAASFDPQSTLVYGIESGYINGYKAALAAAAEREKVLVEALERIKEHMGGDDLDGWESPEDVWGIATEALAMVKEPKP